MRRAFARLTEAKSNGTTSQVFAAHSEGDSYDTSIFMVEVTVHYPFCEEKTNEETEEDGAVDGISGHWLHLQLADVQNDDVGCFSENVQNGISWNASS